MQLLEDIANKSSPSQIWVDLLIKLLIIMMMYVRTERESDWTSHIAAVEQMLPYMFTSGHLNYARYELYYLRNIQTMPLLVDILTLNSS